MVNHGVTFTGLAGAFTTFHQGNWHPLTWISHMIDSQLFGMFAGGHLLVNALIHTANTLLLFWFLLRTTHARWSSALVAALFALHPLHVESVAWASERKDTLSTFFGLLSLIAYVRYAKAPSSRRYAWVAITLALGLMSKPMLVTWPFVMLLLDYWPLRRWQSAKSKEQRPLDRFAAVIPSEVEESRRKTSKLTPRGPSTSLGMTIKKLLIEKIPLFALVAASAAITSLAQSHAGVVPTLTEFPLTLRLSNAVVSYAKYLLLALWPNDLAVLYPFPSAGIPAWQIIGAALLLSWNYGILFFSAENPALPHRRLVLVPGNTGSRHRAGSGWPANHGGPLLLYSLDRFVYCGRVRISRYRRKAARSAVAQCSHSECNCAGSCYSYKRTDPSLE